MKRATLPARGDHQIRPLATQLSLIQKKRAESLFPELATPPKRRRPVHSFREKALNSLVCADVMNVEKNSQLSREARLDRTDNPSPLKTNR